MSRILISEIRAMLELHLSANQIARRLNINIEEVKAYIESQGPRTKIYIGGDSERFKLKGEWYADYTLAVVVHIDGKHGCKLFGEVIYTFRQYNSTETL